ncbi:MAG: UDP-N-acetylglucosamine 2-epimerase (non-hydrolyzing) [bacterium]
MKILSIIGTRPEAIKMAPLLQELSMRGGGVISKCCVTAQHRELLDQVLCLFGIAPDYDLNVMTENQSNAEVASKVFDKLDAVIRAERPDWVLVQGDTTTVAAASLVSFYNRVGVGHVEAGLRTGDRNQPFPEEINRRVAGVVADVHFAPTESARRNLLGEGVPDEGIVVTGNTVVDALRWVLKQPFDCGSGPLKGMPWQKRIILVTAHRRENFGKPLRDICRALKEIAAGAPDAHIVYPVHPNPNIRDVVHGALENVENITLLPPLDYLALSHLASRSFLIMTDSGGIQEEAPSLGKPVLILRDRTERPEGVDAGVAKLVGTNAARIVKEVRRLMGDAGAYQSMVSGENPYGDGLASARIVRTLLDRMRK